MTEIEQVYQIKITLKYSKPPIWRRVMVPEGILLPEFHKVIQTAMGWKNAHMHHFISGKNIYCQPGEEFFEDTIDYREIPLKNVLKKVKAKMIYEYDFGDSWEHEIVVEKIMGPEEGKKYPYCIDGKRACPPEDSGGVWGYEDILKILQDRNHKEYSTYVEWIGRKFDPDHFDPKEVNRLLKTRDYGVPEPD
ncbi:MAG: plasmid pRiA4b ORF-3 family protein [Bacteroidales bacterium]|nr:plasmid pRiA4b ORF-3 family protein [Bacteroidales bacterium]